jgi:hypothetical protein
LLNVPAADKSSVQNDTAFLNYMLDMANRFKENINQRVA